MAFGINTSKTNTISRKKTFSGETAFQLDNNGKKVDATVHGSQKEVAEEFYVTSSDAFANSVTEGAHGTNVVTNCELNETNSDYARFTVTRTILPDDSSFSS